MITCLQSNFLPIDTTSVFCERFPPAFACSRIYLRGRQGSQRIVRSGGCHSIPYDMVQKIPLYHCFLLMEHLFRWRKVNENGKLLYVSLHKHSLSVFLLSAKTWLLCLAIKIKPFVNGLYSVIWLLFWVACMKKH